MNHQQLLKREYSQIGMWECTFRGLDHSGSQPFNIIMVCIYQEGKATPSTRREPNTRGMIGLSRRLHADLKNRMRREFREANGGVCLEMRFSLWQKKLLQFNLSTEFPEEEI